MSQLSEQEIMKLLETMDPDEIETSQKDRLDAPGRRLLAELSRDIRSGQEVFAGYGRRFRAADATPLAAEGDSKENQNGVLVWLLRSISVPHWVLGAVAVLAGLVMLPSLLDWGDVGTTRGRSLNLDDIGPINEELVEVFIKRGTFLMEAGNQSGNRDHYREARDDLMQAYELAPKNITLLELLARVHEKLGEDRKAARFLAEWEVLREEERKP